MSADGLVGPDGQHASLCGTGRVSECFIIPFPLHPVSSPHCEVDILFTRCAGSGNREYDQYGRRRGTGGYGNPGANQAAACVEADSHLLANPLQNMVHSPSPRRRYMAKKKKQEPVKPEEPKGTLAKAKEAVVKAAGKVAEVATQAAGAVKEHVVQPVVEAVKPKKRARFVREKKEKRPKPTGPALPPRSTSATAKLMTKGLALPPKDDAKGGPKPKT